MLEQRGTGEETGPLEATIKNLGREIDTKGSESKELQRRWIGCQQELVGLQNENGGLTETLARLRAEHTVLFQKKRCGGGGGADAEGGGRGIEGGVVDREVDGEGA